MYSFSWGLYERHQQWLLERFEQTNKTNESLMLEPIGYIPIMPIAIHCQIGWRLPVVTEYRQKYGVFGAKIY